MVSDTRSTRKSKDESDDHGSKKNVDTRKDSLVRSPANMNKTSVSRQMTPSPQSTRKSKRLDKEVLPSSPPENRKSERLGKYNTSSPLRRSDRGKKDLSSSFLGSKQSANEPIPSEPKRKKEKTLIQVTMESKRAELDHEVVGMKRKKMNARMFKAQFKRQRIVEIVPDDGEELGSSEKIFDVCSDNSRDNRSERMGMVVGELRDGVGRASNGAVESISTSKGCPTEVKNDNHVSSSLRDYVVDEPCSKYSYTSSSVRNMSDNQERFPMNCSTTENMYASESDDSVSLDGSERCLLPKVAEATASPTSNSENCNLLGTCVLCSKNKRVSYDSPEQELCSCSSAVSKDLSYFTTFEDRSDLGAAVTSDSQLDGQQNLCALCNKDGKLLCCVGKGCKSCYHLYCFDLSLSYAPPGIWHCPQCVKKKLLFGAHSVSEGVESIWEVRKVEVPNVKGVWQTQYLVKYQGLAHIHNHWVSEKQLLLENPCVVSNFVEKDKVVSWSAEWMMPHRLLRKRSIEDTIFIASATVILVCEYEWLVKWRGLDYNHATWELDNSNFISSSLGHNLMKDYELRRQKAKQEINEPYTGSLVKLPELPSNRSHVNENYVLKKVNKLREFFFKCLNAVIFDDQDRAMTVIFFIQSMSEYQPFLIVTTSSSLSQWESEFAQLVPSVDVVVYTGSETNRKGIRASEFHDENGCMMIQVLLSSVEAVSEDLEILKSIKWKAIVIDEYQHSGILKALEQMKTFSTDLRILLVSGQIKDTTSEYLKLLSLLESQCDFEKLRSLKPETNDNLCKLKDRLSRFIPYGRTSQASKFIEYWIPVKISNYQLEQYCDALLSNSIPLGSCSRSDPVGVLRDILLTVRKCCNHPYLLDPSVQERLIAEQRPAAELLDIGIKASGKLQCLDVMLAEIKTRGLQVLILFQLIIGSRGTSTGDILDDFLRQRCGQNAYERVDAGITPSKKQAAVNRFNKKETGQFIFLLENRACSSTIKLSSVDVVIVYDSDWNPANDLRALQKISVDSKVDKIKVFRLYSTFTVEERSLVLAKQNLNLDNNLQNFSRTTSDTLLSWGASYLFRKLDEYHADSKSNSDFNFSSDQLLLDEVAKEFRAVLSGDHECIGSNSVISEVKLGVGSYSSNIPVLGEPKVQLKDGVEPHVFWRNLFDGKKPKWKHLSAPSPRNRKRVHYWEGSPNNSETGKDDIVVKKRKKMVNESVDPTLIQVEPGAHQATQCAVSKGGLFQDTLTSPPRPSPHKECNQSENHPRDDLSSLGAEVSTHATSERRFVSSDEQKSLHSVLQGEVTQLCQTLKLTEDVTRAARKFLEYVIKNHHVNSDSPSIVQAFQISLCWVAASIKKQKVDKKDTYMLAKQILNYQCTEEQANSVYTKMRSLKKMYLQSADNFTDSDRESSEVKKLMMRENLAATSDIDNKIMKIQRKYDKRMKKLIWKQQQEIQEFQKIWKDKREELEKDHKLESAFIRSIHGEGSVGLDKLKLLEDNFSKKMEEHNLQKDVQLKKLETEQLDAINEERLKAADLLAKAKACSSEQRAANGLRLVNSQSDDTECPQSSTCGSIFGSGDVFPIPRQQLGNENTRKSSYTRMTDATPSISSISASEATVREAPLENLMTTNSQNEAELIRPAIVELLNQSKCASDKEVTVCANMSAPVEKVSDDILSVAHSEELQVPNEMVGPVHPGELSNASNKESDKSTKIASSDDLVTLRGGTEAASGRLRSTAPSLLLPEQITTSPDCCDLLLQQVQQDAPAVENRSTSQIEIATLEFMNSVAPVPSDLELPITDEIVTTVPSSHVDPVNDNSGELHCSSVGASLNCHQIAATENHDQGRSSSQAAEPWRGETISHGSISQREENLEKHPNHLDVGPSIGAAHEQSVDSSAILPSDVDIPHVVSTLGLSNQAIPQVDIGAGNLHRPIYHVHPIHQPTSRNTTPSMLADPLQTELERMCKETEQLEKTHIDMISQQKSDCEKEIEEVVSQIRKKYEVKLQETEAEFRLKKYEHDKNLKKVLLHKVLAQTFRSKCLEIRPSGLPGTLQGVPTNLMPQRHQLPPQPPFRRSPVPSGSQPSRVSNSAAVQTMQQLSRPHSSRSPVAIQSVAPPSVTALPLKDIQHTAALLSGTSSRPPVIGALTPTVNPRVGGGGGAGSGEIRSPAPHLQPLNPRSGGGGSEIRSPAPHLQPFGGSGGEIRSARIAPHLQPYRPPTAPSISPAASPPVSRLHPAQIRPQPVQLLPQSGPLPRAPPQKPSPNLVPQERAELQGGIPAPPSPSPTTQGLVLGLDHQPAVPEQRPSSLPDISPIFSQLELSDFESSGNVQGNQASAAEKDAVVCLSDDD